jgi:hypothetical protein
MNSSRLLDPSYLLMCSVLNLSDHLTSLSGAARVQKLPLPDGMSSPARDQRGGVNDLAPETPPIFNDIVESSRLRLVSYR